MCRLSDRKVFFNLRKTKLLSLKNQKPRKLPSKPSPTTEKNFAKPTPTSLHLPHPKKGSNFPLPGNPTPRNSGTVTVRGKIKVSRERCPASFCSGHNMQDEAAHSLPHTRGQGLRPLEGLFVKKGAK
ncbi:hypothetical protein JTE90_004482 [Oedothorax gibbosus]|uniref:Uncharacterized protein n=1 Tax=Oedothorax gibbosus TaxID=931172 RepID=A0AAV6U331_9ARAC|nr:hypothetical protein JTE90_004482 [Oedothorax gibbosus]